MMQSVKGIYRDGKVELLESPHNIAEGEVIVTFVRSSAEDPERKESISEAASAPPASISHRDNAKMMYFGMFSDGREQFTAADFKAAEFHGDSDDGLDWS